MSTCTDLADSLSSNKEFLNAHFRNFVVFKGILIAHCFKVEKTFSNSVTTLFYLG